ncbi:microsomal glutathione S-transferase 1-like [Corythoichthys intestinalis]|uniref:microsomal glutathione S-transferase 1-like n=1 Tax=Corythoichthys intestinalis TaxID=161448 RepID=UPI0025A4DEC1|nr:microsomal glutathione S-transferase 1-like [Corythoichthys intestinalis]XP_057709853.1 microsomal glutathione S-transferase 1-like [Corythoichthys intestinalis]XP_061809423.1 microsomal glutathione S-transferase 1-like [Nerophis lumbriciformis]
MLDLMQDEVFRAFSTYALVVILKTMIMAPLTAFYRFKRGSFANEEDVAFKSAEERKKLLRPNPDVERVRRCHLNDLENVVPFVLVGLFYALSGPQLSTALLHFRIFAGCRIFHTISYIGAFPQPCRALSFFAGVGATVSMAYHVLSKVFVL